MYESNILTEENKETTNIINTIDCGEVFTYDLY